MSFIRIENIVKTYGQGEAVVRALDEVSFSVSSGEFVAVMGESGSGKSTLLSVLGAMNTPEKGRYFVDDIDIYALDAEQRADFRREYLGFVFQSFHLMPYLTTLENVMLPLVTVALPRARKQEMALAALRGVGLEDKAQRLPNQLSGGEKERAAVARAIVNHPPILLADEPTGNLDSRNTGEVMELLRSLHDDGMTIVMVTHSSVCAAYAHRILHVRDGGLIADQMTAKEIKVAERQRGGSASQARQDWNQGAAI
jgi:putative ABC transport system ATP-binding protein